MCKLPSGGAQCWLWRPVMNRKAGVLRRDGKQGPGQGGHEQLSPSTGTSAHSLTPTGTPPQRTRTVLRGPWLHREPSDLHFLEIYKRAGNYRKMPGLSWGSNSPDLIYHNTGQRWCLDPHGLCPLDGPQIFPFPPSSPGPSHAASWTRKARGDALSPPGTYVLESMTF